MHTPINPTTIAPPAANYALGVVSVAPRRWLHTSGIVGTAPDGSVPTGLDAQASVIWSSIAELLCEADMGPADVVSVTTYVVDGQELAPVMAARDAFLGDHRASSTLLVVPRLAQAAWLAEVDVVACAE